ncbi:MAG: DinB family protein [Chloroflexi bacterium]|nr:DinB family protein [Chloroflexota bacterium]MBV9133238.1 DinB family protein [Chloroflexota bacterium]MBV9895439.1 DinB family protein [Chloroflexota bacterium]
MQDLIELFRHNTWANAKVFDLAASLDAEFVKEAAAGTRDTVLGTLAHLASVEYAYLRMLEENPPQSIQEVQMWAAHDLTWFPEQMRHLGDRFVRLLESSTPETVEAPLNVPWFTFRLTRREGLRQVLTHSAQHRSQVLSWLSARGTDTPDLDYVLMLREERTPRE